MQTPDDHTLDVFREMVFCDLFLVTMATIATMIVMTMAMVATAMHAIVTELNAEVSFDATFDCDAKSRLDLESFPLISILLLFEFPVLMDLIANRMSQRLNKTKTSRSYCLWGLILFAKLTDEVLFQSPVCDFVDEFRS